MNYFLKKKLKVARARVYEATVISRGKDASFWQPYVEEWAEPPIARAKRASEKAEWYEKLTSPLVKMVFLRVVLLPLIFIPFLTMIVNAALQSLTMAQYALKGYFAAKKMSPFEQQLFMVERQYQFRAFGFVAALLERIPVLGMVFSISNRIGAAMWAHDLEKQQHLYKDGTLKPTKVYRSKESVDSFRASDVPDSLTGSFPLKATSSSKEESLGEPRDTRARGVPPKWEGPRDL